MTLRSIEALKQAEVLFCEDTRVSKKLLSLLSQKLGISFPDYRFISFHSHNEKSVLDSIDPSLFEKQCLYLSDAGMPGISDPGYSLIKYCQEHAIAYDVLPGANAALVAVVMSGFDTKNFLFYGFLPHKGKERENGMNEVLHAGCPVILYESTHRIIKLLGDLAAAAPKLELFAIKEISKLHQKSFKGTAEELFETIKNSNIKGEWAVVINSEIKSEFDPKVLELIRSSDMPKKEASRLLAQLTGKSPKECYSLLLQHP
jgi:16S rRNA (cytidine1402-2'-O)-methyltransferase